MSIPGNRTPEDASAYSGPLSERTRTRIARGISKFLRERGNGEVMLNGDGFLIINSPTLVER